MFGDESEELQHLGGIAREIFPLEDDAKRRISECLKHSRCQRLGVIDPEGLKKDGVGFSVGRV